MPLRLFSTQYMRWTEPQLKVDKPGILKAFNNKIEY